jgi:hypothetical protein
MKRGIAAVACLVALGGCGGGGNEVESLDALGQKLDDAGIS